MPLEFSNVTLYLDDTGIPRDVVLDGRSLGRNTKGAKVDAQAGEICLLTVEIWVSHVDTVRVARDYRAPELPEGH